MRQHSEACGILPRHDCDACLGLRLTLDEQRELHDNVAQDQWERMCRVCPELQDYSLFDSVMVGRFIWALLQPRYKPVLRELLLNVLAEPLGELIQLQIQAMKSQGGNGGTRS